MKLEDATRQFLEYCEIEKNQSQKTIINYQHFLKRFLEFADNIHLKDISQPLIKRYRLHLNRFNPDLSIKTQSYHLIALRAFLKYCAKQDWQTLSPEKIELPKVPERTVEYLSREELERFFEEIDVGKITGRSEERRVGKECRSRWPPSH